MTVVETAPANGQAHPTAKANLVVVGNGMAGIRAIEEVLARDGAERFTITVFGDEPYGNYNRILLSNVLAGVDDPGEIYLNAMDWYTDNGIDLRAGVRVVRVDTFAHLVYADDGTAMRYDKLILATGSRSFFPPMAGLWADDKTLADGVFGFRTLDDTAAMIGEAATRTKAVVI
ncbi:MAG: FAD-dependent oxidoreductase, partial [Mycobacterium sp.]|nr:FAD-dependent oxidoreductase [Mycobacterium sp.]